MLIEHELVSAMIDAPMESQKKSMMCSVELMESQEKLMTHSVELMESQKKSMMHSLELMGITLVFLVSHKQEIDIHFEQSLLNQWYAMLHKYCLAMFVEEYWMILAL